jgi:hypothetical protein
MNPAEKLRPCDLEKLIKSLKLRKARGIDGIPNECLRHLPRRPLVHLTHLINLINPIRLLPSTSKLFEKGILQIVQKYIREEHLLNASQFGFRTRHSTTLQCMRLADHDLKL